MAEQEKANGNHGQKRLCLLLLILGLLFGFAAGWFAKPMLPSPYESFAPNPAWLGHVPDGSTEPPVVDLLNQIKAAAAARLGELDPGNAEHLAEILEITDVLAEIPLCASGHATDQPDWDEKHGFLVTARTAAQAYDWATVKLSTGLMHGH